ncbi:MAG: hypothetical protein ACK5JD_02990 [Mangrovibacterium sp.]
MKQSKAQRTELYQKMEAKLKFPTRENCNTLYHHIHTMRLGDDYIFNTEADLAGLLEFLNAETEVGTTVG